MNWNQYSEDENDSWMNSNDSEEQLTAEQPKEKPPQQQNSENQPNTQPQQQNSKKEEKPEKQVRPQKKYLTDEEILAKLEGGEIEEDRKIKIVRYNEEELKVLKENKLIKNFRQYKTGQIAYFHTKDGLKQFIKDKIQKKSKYKLQIFIRNPNFNKDEEKRKPREKHEKERGDNKEEKEDNTHKKETKKLQKGIQIHKNENHVRISNSQASVEEAVQIIQQKINKQQWSKLHILSTLPFLEYCYEIAEEIYKRWKFSLTNQIKESNFSDGSTFELILDEKGKHIQLPKKKKFSWVRQINQNVEKYFEKIQKSCSSIISGNEDKNQKCEFDQKQYLELFKKNYQEIASKYNKWVVKGFGKNIATILKLSYAFKKNLPNHKVELQVGSEENSVYCLFEIQDFSHELPKERKKADVSGINSYLNG